MDDSDTMRLRIWRARSSPSRAVGAVLVVVSVVLFAVAYVMPGLTIEISAISAFAVGIVLLASEIESRIRHTSASAAILGSMQFMVSTLNRGGRPWAVVYSPEVDGVVMRPIESSRKTTSFPACGHGLYESYERELGELKAKGIEYTFLWLPKVMVDGLGLAEGVKMAQAKETVSTALRKPFVRLLCVNEFMNKNVCGTTGCPLVASVAEVLASSTGKRVSHDGCIYDPMTQTATAKHTILA